MMLVTTKMDTPTPRNTDNRRVIRNDCTGIRLMSMSMYNAVAHIAIKNPNFYALSSLILNYIVGVIYSESLIFMSRQVRFLFNI